MKLVFVNFHWFILSFFLIYSLESNAQSQEKIKIAVFAPLYIDEAFTNNELNFQGNSIPKHILPGLEFYNGIMLGVDSLTKAGLTNIDLKIFDSKSNINSIDKILRSVEFENTKLIIASFNQRSEIKPLSTYALNNKIPLVSATFPNDGGVLNNPYFFVFNPTIRSHCNAILNHIQKSYLKANINLITKEGVFEKTIVEHFNDFNKNMDKKTEYNLLNLTDSFSKSDIALFLDSTKQNILIGGVSSLAFTNKLAKIASELKQYKITIIGLPVWEQMKFDDNLKREGLEVLYSSSYNFDKKNKTIAQIDKKYNYLLSGNPTDMVYKGFENIVKFATIIATPGNFVELSNNLTSQVFSKSKFTPIHQTNNSEVINFFENTGIQLLRKL